MLGQKKVIETMFSGAGININGPDPWDIHVHDDRFYGRLLGDKNLGLGEAYIEGMWDCSRIDEFICRILKADLNKKIKGNLKSLFPYLSALIFNPQPPGRSRHVAERHYDLGNDLFASFLDPYNQYSCAYFNGTDDLKTAQLHKLDLICKKIELAPDDHVLDIGCGWGGGAKYAAERYGCTVTGINISKEQVHFARELCKNLPVNIVECEYRDIQGEFDKIVSIGMFEHVGRKNYRTFMRVVSRCLKDDGIFLLQTIGGNKSQIKCDPWIAKYIFPNSMLPSIAQIGKAAEGLFVMEDWHNLSPHYDRTLMAWYENFTKAWQNLKGRYDDHFRRMWEYYLLSCAGAFRARKIQLWQIIFTKVGKKQTSCRKKRMCKSISFSSFPGKALAFNVIPRKSLTKQQYK
jgi:cyclopropane-fatty-acyl-phospholipid synthase